ncbi:MAG: ribonuclease II, partial [Spirochaetales bacterium]|nr:ribonuclease II [Spirochaetales bacterium]
MIPLKSLGVYKNKPAWVAETGEKLTLLLPGGETLKVREKDIEVIFPGPCTIVPIENSDPEDRDVREAWELLSIFAGPSTLKELAELVFLEFSPQSAWGAWRLLAGGLYFSGTPSALVCRPEAWVRAEQERRAAKETQGRDFEDLIRRLRSGELDPSADRRYVQELEALALGRAPGCRILKALGREESPGEAHALLLQTGVWTLFYDPHPARAGCPEGSALLPPPPPRPEPRRDLTGLPAFAIDSPWSDDPDDAVSLEGEALYVHVADPTASLNAGDEAEGE